MLSFVCRQQLQHRSPLADAAETIQPAHQEGTPPVYVRLINLAVFVQNGRHQNIVLIRSQGQEGTKLAVT